MNVFVLIIVGMAGVGLGVYLARRRQGHGGQARRGRGEVEKATRGVVKERSAAKEENVERVRALARERGRITNDDVELALGVSDATATRYLEELEKEGVLRQVGAEGRHVYYEPR